MRCWLWLATTIHVRDSIDDFMSDLHQARWLLAGAAFTVLASVVTLVAHIWPVVSEVSESKAFSSAVATSREGHRSPSFHPLKGVGYV